MDSAAANRYLTGEERGWLKEAREEIAMDAVGLCHDVPVMLGRYAAALKALEEAQAQISRMVDGGSCPARDPNGECVELNIAISERDEAQGKLDAVRELNSHLIPSHSPVLDRILRGSKEDE